MIINNVQNFLGFDRYRNPGLSNKDLDCPHPDILEPVLGIRTRIFLGLPDPHLLVRGMNLDPSPDPSLLS